MRPNSRSQGQDPGRARLLAEELEVENASTMRKQGLMFGILKQLRCADRYHRRGRGRGAVRQLLPALAGPNYLPGPDGIYVNPRGSAASACAPATPSTASSIAQGRRALLRCSRSTASISRTRRRRATRSTSTTSPRSIPTSGCGWARGIKSQEGPLAARHRYHGRSARASAR